MQTSDDKHIQEVMRAAGPGWVITRDAYWPDPSDIYMSLLSLPIPSAVFYISVQDLQSDRLVDRLSAYFDRSIADFVSRHLKQLLQQAPKEVQAAAHGFEIWTTTEDVTGHNDVYLHLDNDEGIRASQGKIVMPLMGSILHLGPARDLEGGETLFVHDPRAMSEEFPAYDMHDWGKITQYTDAVEVVTQQAGRLVMFAGDMAHGAAPVRARPDGQPRIAFLANIWGQRITDVPKGICSVTPKAFQQGDYD